MIAGLAAALALASTPAQSIPAEAAQAQAPSVAAALVPAAMVQAAGAVSDPIGDIIQTVQGTLSEAVTLVEIRLKTTLYHAGLRARDSLGCKLVPMRTVAVDPSVTPRHSILFIKETVGLRMPDGSRHDGYWY